MLREAHFNHCIASQKHTVYRLSAVFQGAVVFCIITRLVMTQNQVQGKCAEVRTHTKKKTGHQSVSVDFKVLIVTFEALHGACSELYCHIRFRVLLECNLTSSDTF